MYTFICDALDDDNFWRNKRSVSRIIYIYMESKSNQNLWFNKHQAMNFLVCSENTYANFIFPLSKQINGCTRTVRTHTHT